MKMIMRELIAITLLICTLQSFPQDYQPLISARKELDIFQRFDNYTTKDGLPSNFIIRILQDRDGFLWLATDNGLSRFDGYSFVNFQPIEGDSTSLSNKYVTSIAQDKDGYIWVGTENGLNRFDSQKGTFKQFFKENSTIINDNHIRGLLVCSDGFLWIDCANANLSQVETKKLESTFYSRPGKAFTSYSNHAIYEAKNREIWAGGIGIPTITVNKKKSSLIVIRDTIVNNNNIYAPASEFFEDDDGLFWIGNTSALLTINDLNRNIHYPIKDYPCVYSICSDKNGNIWFGGYSGGAMRFNKKNNMITHYTNNSNNPNSICGSQTFDILCDKSGSVWFATNSGLSRYSYYKYKFPLYRHIPETNSPASSQITAIFQDSDEDIIIGTQNAGIIINNSKDNTFNTYKHITNNPETIGSEYITAIDQDKSGTIWFSLWNGDNCSLSSFDKNGKKFKRYRTLDIYNWYSDVKCTPNGEILGGSWGGGVVYLNKTLGDLYKILPCNVYGFPTMNNEVRNIVCDNEGRIWSQTEYINAYNTLTKNHIMYAPLFDKRQNFTKIRLLTIPNKKIDFTLNGEEYLFTDSKANFWFINKRVIAQYLNVKDNFCEYVINKKIIPTSISNKKNGTGFWIGGTNYIYSFSPLQKKVDAQIELNNLGDINLICEIEDNQLIIGSSTGLYSILLNSNTQNVNSLKKTSTILFKNIVKLNSNDILLGGDQGLFLLNKNLKDISNVYTQEGKMTVYSLFKAKNNEIYIGTNIGLLQYEENVGLTKQWKFNSYKENQLQGNKIVSITQALDESIWVLSDICVSKLNSDNQTFTNFIEPAKTDLTGNLISTLFIDQKGYLWVGTSNGQGLNRVNQTNGSTDHFVNLLWDSTSIRKGDINDIFESHDGVIWIATSNGLCQFNEQTMNFTHYDKRNGFASEVIMAVNEDNKGNLWLSTLNGLSCFNPKNSHCYNYSWKDGLQGGDFSKGATIKLNNGKLVFGGMEGYNMFYPDSVKLNPYKTSPIISSIRINGLVRYFSNPHNINLKYSERNIEISFSSNDFNFPENNKIEYKLEGFDNEFTKVDINRIATYTNLYPGNYQFVIKACNNDGLWCTTPLSLSIRVGYPIWFRWWAIIFEIAILFATLFLIVKYRTLKVVKQKQKLEKEVAARTEQLLAKNEEVIIQRDTLSKQKDHIHKIHNQLSDSLEYAQFLQSSFYLNKVQRDVILGDNFLLQLPKEKVGGDFFWTTQAKEKIIFAIVDCTGHGVPGALMSMIGFTSIKDVAQSNVGTDPSLALNSLHLKVTSDTLPDSSETSMLKAMDVGYCVLDRSINKLYFAGGHIDILIARRVNGKKSIAEIKGENKRVGNSLQACEFRNNELDVSSGDYIYLYSDGLADQFNSEKNEKFSKRRVKELISFISDFPFEVQSSLILSKFYEWKGTNEQTDDITVLGVKV